ncbi:hypothetical protein IT570_03470 [Candidatus Sumerlaeota bacterium]|nr:hypothetical protein [Candidatus Sumerlaeota bacterium]
MIPQTTYQKILREVGDLSRAGELTKERFAELAGAAEKEVKDWADMEPFYIFAPDAWLFEMGYLP